jgi:hypothetical protein
MRKTALQLRNVFSGFWYHDRLEMFVQSTFPSNERLWRVIRLLAWWRIRLQLETGSLFMKYDDLE